MYILEGNIGAGKSTFLKLLEKALPYISIGLEPKNNWLKQIDGQCLLENFYKDAQRWAYTLETFSMICRVNEHHNEQERSHPFHIIERSIYSGYYCFAKNDFENGFMTELEWNIYQRWFTFLTGNCLPPQGFIYLRVEPEIALERTKMRNRSAEKNISLDYLQQIHRHHEQFLVEKEDVLSDILTIPTLILDGNYDFEHNPAVFEQNCSVIEDFLIQTQSYVPHKGKSIYTSARIK